MEDNNTRKLNNGDFPRPPIALLMRWTGSWQLVTREIQGMADDNPLELGVINLSKIWLNSTTSLADITENYCW